MDFGIAGKTALVTASSKGLGRESAIALAAEGANVVICARNEEALEKTAADIHATGANILAIPIDVTEVSAPQRLVAATVEQFGSLDILVANAGGPPATRALDVTDDALTMALNNNLATSIRLVQASVPHMKVKAWGRICLIASTSVKQPIGTLALSNTARTGLWAWAKTAAQDLFSDGITLNLACPGYHATDRLKQLGGTPNGEAMGDPADFGAVVAFLCSQQAAFVSASAVSVDGGRVVGLL